MGLGEPLAGAPMTEEEVMLVEEGSLLISMSSNAMWILSEPRACTVQCVPTPVTLHTAPPHLLAPYRGMDYGSPVSISVSVTATVSHSSILCLTKPSRE